MTYYLSLILYCFLLLIAFVYGNNDKQTRNNKLSKRYVRYLGFILAIEFLRLLSIYVLDIKIANYLFPFYIAGEFFLVLSFFQVGLKKERKKQTLITIVTGCLFIESIAMWFVFDNATIGYGKTISHLTIVLTAAYILVKNLKELETNNPFLIVYAALFLYYSVSLFLFLLMSQLTKSTIHIWTINNLLSCILYGSSIYTFHLLKKSY